MMAGLACRYALGSSSLSVHERAKQRACVRVIDPNVGMCTPKLENVCTIANNPIYRPRATTSATSNCKFMANALQSLHVVFAVLVGGWRDGGMGGGRSSFALYLAGHRSARSWSVGGGDESRETCPKTCRALACSMAFSKYARVKYQSNEYEFIVECLSARCACVSTASYTVYDTAAKRRAKVVDTHPYDTYTQPNSQVRLYIIQRTCWPYSYINARIRYNA